MAEYRRSAHAVFDLKYHLVWITKYRYKVLRGRVAERTRDLIRQSCEAREVVIIRGAVSPDHIHMLVSAPAHLANVKDGTIHQGAFIAKVAGGISGTAQEVLGAAHVGARVLLRDRWARLMRRLSKRISKTRSGTKTIKGSKLQRPPSLKPAVSRDSLQAASAAPPTFSRTRFYRL
jgi:hypothetical protein